VVGVQLLPLEVRTAEDLEEAFESASSAHVEGLLVLPSPLTIPSVARIAHRALGGSLPAISDRREFVQAGGLMAYGPRIADLFSRAAYYVDRILKGTKPADLPVEQPMTFDFVVNLKTARELGITFPREILLQVTEVVE
jgi:putative ABC transport system substrate-binding protein